MVGFSEKKSTTPCAVENDVLSPFAPPRVRQVLSSKDANKRARTIRTGSTAAGAELAAIDGTMLNTLVVVLGFIRCEHVYECPKKWIHQSLLSFS